MFRQQRLLIQLQRPTRRLLQQPLNLPANLHKFVLFVLQFNPTQRRNIGPVIIVQDRMLTRTSADPLIINAFAHGYLAGK